MDSAIETITPFKTLAVQHLRLAVRRTISREFADRMHVAVRPELDRMVVDLSGYVAANVMREDRKTIKRPANWWDAVKERFVPTWLHKYANIRYETIDTMVRHIHACPHLPISDRHRETHYHLNYLTPPGSR